MKVLRVASGVCLIFLAAQSTLAVQLLRGPYLQMPTPSRVTIRWRTDTQTNSRVQFGTNLSSLNLIENSGSFTNHEVQLSNLLASTTYYYSVGCSSTNLASGSAYFFVTSPLAAKPTRIWAIGDSGTPGSSVESVRDSYTTFAGARRTDVWLTLGDNAYLGGSDPQYQVAVFDTFRDLLRQNAVWPSLGNDEIQNAFEAVFTLPRNGEAGGIPSNDEAYYAFDYGNIHFIALNSNASNIDISTNGLMYRWVKRDLAARTNKWLIAYWHHPPYSH